MKLLRSVFAVLAVGALVGFVAQEASAQKGKKKGTFVKVKTISEKELVGTTGKKGEEKEVKFTINDKTQFKKSEGFGKEAVAATAKDVKEGGFVIVVPAEGAETTAATITIFSRKKKDA